MVYHGGGLGDAAMTSIALQAFSGAGATKDASILEFTATVTNAAVTTLAIDLIFGSDEYPEWANSSYVDIAAAIVNGVNYGLFSNGSPLSITSANNAFNNVAANQGLPIEYDGVSGRLTVLLPVSPGVNQIRLGVADTGDSSYDSGLFVSNLRALSGTDSTGVKLEIVAPSAGGLVSSASPTQEIAEIIYGSDFNDTIVAGAGDDYANSSGGNDYFDMGDGNDYAQGGSGNDTFEGGSGSDILEGGSGQDTFKGSVPNFSGDTINDFGSGDTLFFTSATLTGGNFVFSTSTAASSLSNTATTSASATSGSASQTLVSIDTNKDGTVDGSFVLKGSFSAANFSVSNSGGNSVMTFTPTPTSYTVPGTLGNDYFVPSGGNSYQGGGGSDTYIISPHTLTSAVTAKISDTEGANVVQWVDGTTISAATFYADAAQLTLSTGAVVQVLGASKFSYQLGANAPAGDGASGQTYAQFAAALGGSLPIGSSPVSITTATTVPSGFSAAAAPTPATAGVSYTVPGTLGNDFFIPSGGNSYQGGGGSDTYIISPNTLSGSVTAKISDTEGANVVQWVDGMTISAATFYTDAAQLTLATGAKVQILGASKFSYQLGANAPGNDSASSLSYAEFAAALGVSLPAAGAAPVNSSTSFVVPTGGSGGSFINLSSGAVTATSAAEEFRYDFQLVGGRATKAGDGEVSISGFDVTKDKLAFVNTSNATTYTEAQFKALAGVSIFADPFASSTSIYFDPVDGTVGGVTLTGIVDADLAQIVLQTTV